MKELFRETDVVKNVEEVQFSIFSSSEIQQVSQVEIYKNDFYIEGNSATPSPNGVLDTRMGVSQKNIQCTTCSKPSEDCVGHFGHIDLERPVFHLGFFKNILNLLQNICKRCSHILLKPADMKKLSKEAKQVSKSKSFLRRKDLYKKVNERCKKVTLCPNCGFQNGVVKKVIPLKIVHEQFRNCKPSDVNLAKFKATFNHAIESNKDLEAMLPGKPVEYIQPRDAFNLFREIPSDHLPLFCMDSEFGHPADLIMWKLPAAPNAIRPSVVSDLKAGTNEDDISQMYVDILFLNNTLKKKISTTTESSMDTWECLQLTTALLMNAELNLPMEIGLKRKNTRGFFQRLKGKQGRFRGNLSGKRVNFSSRTVISPDPNLRIYEVGVPVEVAKVLTYPEIVTLHNINIMREMVKNGPDVHPGAIYLEQRRFSGIKKSLKYVNRDQKASELRNGDVIQRHLMDGDIVLFNRQPSLHKMSIMCHRVKVLPGRTFRFNECVCGPYNADFDGDEMNLHVPQTEEARAEALFLMGVNSNLVTPRHGALIIGATQDFLTGSYLLTQKNQFFSREKAMELISSILCGKEDRFNVQLPVPAIIYPVELWTGKQIFSTILCQYKEDNKKNFPFPLCNLITKRKEYTNKGEEFCTREGFIIFRNSELLAGVLDKGLLGSGSKKNLFYTILKDYGKDKSADAMYRVARLTSQYLTNTGFSIGIGDVLPGKALLDAKKKLLNEGYNKCNKYIEQLATGELISQPGCTLEETLEAVILRELSSIRDEAGKECVKELHKSNVALVMALSGSKGSFINISQMIACVGQQAVSGKRVTSGFDNRALPHFKRFSKIPAARGFVSNSFFSGLTPTEFFFHTMAGREGLVDTAVKTAETGYMQRRLVKSLEDLYVAYDMTVRNSTQDVIQFSYGGDGLDPSELEDMDGPLNFERALYHVRALNHYPNEDLISGTHILELTKQYFDNCKGSFNVLSPEYKESILKFLATYGQTIDMKRSGLPVIEKQAGKTNAIDYVERLTPGQLIDFLNSCINRYQSSIMEPGTAVGALCAQSIGEPGTQMTLKTFHFAGVAAMNITLGVPRILEILNASRTISTPIIEAKLKCDTDSEIARQVKGRIEKTLLGEVCEYIEESIGPGGYFLVIRLALERIKLLKLEVSAETIKYSIFTSKLKIKLESIYISSDSMLCIRPSETKDYSPFYHLQYIKRHIQQVVIKGLPSISRAIINQEDIEATTRYKLLIEGNNLREVIATYGIEGTKCTSNNTSEVFTTLGIEAARSTIIREITTTMETHGLSIDHRHVMLLADLMTCRGQVLGITRHGLNKMKESVLRLASFEKTNDHLFDAAFYGQNNPITGVSECIIMGKPMSIGTGVLKLLHKHEMWNNKKPKVNKLDLVFDHPEFHLPLAQNGWI